ncbi:hypothetical protein MPTK1_5g06910 [Marchantia polymorpha subsp. ruderalis]|uniref:Uncharacterized protein n=2 Tax=Marchantia polymorpha TaxID=3197 RepID=A0AAF6BFR3_MARPO|nr:hypothetical protein MARPO_0136s0031 [Marchantia polymorpha]BBN10847.1 hypothetical protein Mp_5g06910 [Marchantia polymorpha subsp. ruderalis]|eukprot:PTQ29704.1 hypothetical protein MARPO_0136s0031 [Marchantia polymorpha]
MAMSSGEDAVTLQHRTDCARESRQGFGRSFGLQCTCTEHLHCPLMEEIFTSEPVDGRFLWFLGACLWRWGTSHSAAGDDVQRLSALYWT